MKDKSRHHRQHSFAKNVHRPEKSSSASSVASPTQTSIVLSDTLGFYKRALVRKKWSSCQFTLYTDGRLYRKNKYCIDILKSLPFILFGHYTKYATEEVPNDVWSNQHYLIFIPNLDKPKRNLWIMCNSKKQFNKWASSLMNIGYYNQTETAGYQRPSKTSRFINKSLNFIRINGFYYQNTNDFIDETTSEVTLNHSRIWRQNLSNYQKANFMAEHGEVNEEEDESDDDDEDEEDDDDEEVLYDSGFEDGGSVDSFSVNNGVNLH